MTQRKPVSSSPARQIETARCNGNDYPISEKSDEWSEKPMKKVKQHTKPGEKQTPAGARLMWIGGDKEEIGDAEAYGNVHSAKGLVCVKKRGLLKGNSIDELKNFSCILCVLSVVSYEQKITCWSISTNCSMAGEISWIDKKNRKR
jgi:hypothetical protein